eukprot:7666520-Alexandrium_andersonii.AAC.1
MMTVAATRIHSSHDQQQQCGGLLILFVSHSEIREKLSGATVDARLAKETVSEWVSGAVADQ